MTSYTVGDALIRIKNARMAGRYKVTLPKSKMVLGVVNALLKEGILREVKEGEKDIVVDLKIHKKYPLLLDLSLVSKPGLRVYKGFEELASHKGASFFIVSTSKGVMSSKEAIDKKLGGEVIAEIL